MILILSLPYPPAANVYYRTGKGRMYLSQAGRRYKEKVAELISTHCPPIENALQGRLSVFMGVSAPSARHRDIDSHAKAVLDALQDAGVFDDDEQVEMLMAVRLPKAKGGYCNVVIIEE
jgi:crossover junction endodeoxyribonuclease RusA